MQVEPELALQQRTDLETSDQNDPKLVAMQVEQELALQHTVEQRDQNDLSALKCRLSKNMHCNVDSGKGSK